jgi:hypothetical protein
MKNKNRRNESTEAERMNNRTYSFYYDRLVELAISMFEWKNLPKSIDPRYLELTLFTDGMLFSSKTM